MSVLHLRHENVFDGNTASVAVVVVVVVIVVVAN